MARGLHEPAGLKARGKIEDVDLGYMFWDVSSIGVWYCLGLIHSCTGVFAFYAALVYVGVSVCPDSSSVQAVCQAQCYSTKGVQGRGSKGAGDQPDRATGIPYAGLWNRIWGKNPLD
jgi:hypothetical protein